MPHVQAEDSGLLGPLQSPNWLRVCLISMVFFLPASIELGVEKCLGLSVGDRVVCLHGTFNMCTVTLYAAVAQMSGSLTTLTHCMTPPLFMVATEAGWHNSTRVVV